MNMPVTAIDVDGIAESTISEDGKKMLLSCTQQSPANAFTLAFNHGDLISLIHHAVTQFARGEAIQGADKSRRTTFPVTAWAIDPVASGEKVLSLTLPDGGVISFLLDAASVAQIHEVLGMMLKPAEPHQSETQKH